MAEELRNLEPFHRQALRNTASPLPRTFSQQGPSNLASALLQKHLAVGEVSTLASHY